MNITIDSGGLHIGLINFTGGEISIAPLKTKEDLEQLYNQLGRLLNKPDTIEVTCNCMFDSDQMFSTIANGLRNRGSK